MKVLPGVIFIFIAILVSAVIILRSVFGINITGYYEVIGILSGLGVIFSLIIAEKKSAHVVIDLWYYSDGSLLCMLRSGSVLIIYLALTCGQFWAAYESWSRNCTTMMLEFPTWVLYLTSGLGLAVLSIITIKKLFKRGTKEC